MYKYTEQELKRDNKTISKRILAGTEPKESKIQKIKKQNTKQIV